MECPTEIDGCRKNAMEVKSCGEPPSVTNAGRDINSGTVGDVVTYTCNTGYTGGPAGATCQETGQWTTPGLTCTIRSCGEPPSVNNAGTNSNSGTVGDVVTYTCNTGYTGGTAGATCQATGYWTTPGLTCTINCGVPPSVNNAGTNINSGTYGDVVTYTCNTGYSGGSAQAACQNTGQWTTPALTCTINCGVPPSVDNAGMNINSGTVGDVVTYTCNTGYSGGPAGATCQNTGQWTTPALTCTINCGVPPSVNNAGTNINSGTYGDVVTYTCNTGYSGGSAQAACQNTGQWTTPALTCTINCGVPPSVDNAGTNINSGTVGDVVTYTCNTGYSGGPAGATCQNTGQWTTPALTCTINCGVPPSVNNAGMNINSGTVGDVVTYTCNTGYSGGPAQATCQNTGQWTTPALTCTIRSCGEPPSVNNAGTNINSGIYGDVVTYTCNTGYNGGPAQATCQETGQWTTPALTCTIRSCGEPPSVNNAGRTSDSGSYGDTVTYTCNTGYTGGPAQATCQATRQWSTPGLTCTIRSCGEPPSVNNAGTNINSGIYGDVVTYTCNTGYNGGPAQATCQETGQWTTPGLTCTIRSCGEPPSVNNAGRTSDSGSYGDTVTYTCNTGYTGGPAQATCQATRYWTTPGLTCTIRSCGEPPSVNNAGRTSDSGTSGDVVTYTCNTGYTGGTAEATCQATGQWTTPGLTCTIRSCGEPPSVNNAGRTSDSGSYGDTVTYTCNTGYTGGPAQATCQATRQWSTPGLTCTIKSCGEPPSVNNAGRTSDLGLYGDTVTYTCNTGYTGGPAQATCQASGYWTTPALTCTINCGEPPSVNNAGRDSDSGTYGDTVTYTCNTGYTGGTAQATCQETGYWTTPGLTCTIKSCGAPPSVTNAGRTSNSGTYGDTVTYTCNTGYTGGTAQTTCQATGYWTTPALTCTIKSCGAPPSVTNAGRTSNSGTYGDTVTYTCNTGYTGGTAQTTCQATGQWTTLILTCPIVSCGVAPFVANMVRSSTDSKQYQERVTYSCNDGYNSNGQSGERTCLNTGQWSSLALTCTIVSCGPVTVRVGMTSSGASGSNYQDTVTYSCEPGYTSNYQSGLSTCQSNGDWSVPSLTCTIVSCGPVTVRVGMTSGGPSGSNYGDTVMYSCKPGYTSNSQSGLSTCQSNGHWSVPSLTCTSKL
ncbi:hypothetical protein ScPMuIL_012960 [Solemya velum]